MHDLTWVIVVLLLALAAANGANDVSKGVATLAGAGVVAYRTAIVWGTATTALGALLAIPLGHGMGRLFSTGIVAAPPATGFALAVLLGTTSWVVLASVLRLPVSTTHAIVGSLVGAGLLLAPASVRWTALATQVAVPLLVSIVAAYALSVALALTMRAARRHSVPAPTTVPARVPATDQTDGTDEPSPAGTRLVTGLHWLSSGATGAARGLNDTPKLAAVGGFALVPAGYSTATVTLLTALAMAAGSLAGVRVARALGDGVVRLSHTEGLTANVTTALLVGAGAVAALPMSTTHVSTGGIVGATGGALTRVSGRTLRDFAIAWTVTPIFAGAVAAAIAAIAT